MSGPFPGMDPYMEAPELWYGAHNKLIGYIETALNAILPTPYFASVEGRCYIERSPDPILPDIVVSRQTHPINAAASGGTAVAEPFDPALHFHVPLIPVEEAFINIYTGVDRRQVVTTVELLSHTNKNTRNEGYRLYREKQQAVLASHSNLIEIDLLRRGKHSVAVPEIAFEPEHRHDYLVCLHRAGAGANYEVWLNSLPQRLPRIAVPLTANDPDVPLDLQTVFDKHYDEGLFRRKLDYRGEPVPPLTGSDAAWADSLLRADGLRF